MTNKNYPTLKIEGNGEPSKTRIYLDGMELTKSVIELGIDISVDVPVPTVGLRLRAYIDADNTYDGMKYVVEENK